MTHPIKRIVTCPGTVVSPAPTPAQEALGLRPNMECGALCEVVTLAPQMHFKCPRGHDFIATPSDVSELAI